MIQTWQKARIIDGVDNWKNRIVWVYGPPELVCGEALNNDGQSTGIVDEEPAYLTNVINPKYGRLLIRQDCVELLPEFKDENEIEIRIFDEWFSEKVDADAP